MVQASSIDGAHGDEDVRRDKVIMRLLTLTAHDDVRRAA
jgi:hypothetical protein